MARGTDKTAPLREAENPKERWVRDEAELDSAGEEDEEEGGEDGEYDDHDEKDDATQLSVRRHGDSESNSEPEEDDEEDMLRQSMADVPFEELLQARADGWTTGSQFRKKGRPADSEATARDGIRSKAVGERQAEGRAAVEKQQRANKNRPMEVSSKKPVSRFRAIIEAPKRIVRDPRFEDLCGQYDDDRFRKAYGFIYSEAMPEEKEALLRSLKKTSDPRERSLLQQQVTDLDSALKRAAAKSKEAEREAERKRKEREAVKEGKRPFYHTKASERRQELTEKYKELKEAGKLEAFLARRRKRNATKERTKLPGRREAGGSGSR